MHPTMTGPPCVQDIFVFVDPRGWIFVLAPLGRTIGDEVCMSPTGRPLEQCQANTCRGMKHADVWVVASTALSKTNDGIRFVCVYIVSIDRANRVTNEQTSECVFLFASTTLICGTTIVHQCSMSTLPPRCATKTGRFCLQTQECVSKNILCWCSMWGGCCFACCYPRN